MKERLSHWLPRALMLTLAILAQGIFQTAHADESEGYTVNIGDEIRISFPGESEFSKNFTVNRDVIRRVHGHSGDISRRDDNCRLHDGFDAREFG